MKFPYHLPFKSQLYQHKWHYGKMNSRFDHRRLDLVLWENLIARRKDHPTGFAEHGKHGSVPACEVDPLFKQYKYVKTYDRPLRLVFERTSQRNV